MGFHHRKDRAGLAIHPDPEPSGTTGGSLPLSLFIPLGDSWWLRHGNGTSLEEHLAKRAGMLGLEYVHRLLQRPSESIAPGELYRSVNLPPDEAWWHRCQWDKHRDSLLYTDPGYKQSVRSRPLLSGYGHQDRLDREAVRDYRRRRRQCKETIEAAEKDGDHALAQGLNVELEFINATLARDTDRRGRSRRFEDADQERVRKAVGKAIREALDRLARAMPDLAACLRHRVRESERGFVYMPRGSEVCWVVSIT
jgi:hypothetical protein